MGISAREIAVKILYNIEQGAYSDAAIKEKLRGNILPEDSALITELVYGVTCYKIKLDYIIEQYSKLPLKRLSKWILIILRMGIYQLLFLDRIPESAAVNESVKLAKRYGHTASAGYVNGMLRNIARSSKKIEYNDISILYSHPAWLVDLWTKEYGADFTKQLLAANNNRADVTIRVNKLKCTAEELEALLKQKGIQTKVINDRCIQVKGTGNIEQLDEYQKGFFTVQDISSMYAVEALAPKAGEFVIDACAAPGGKTTYMAELMQNEGTILAFDLYEHKIDLLRKNAARMGLDIIQPCLQNAENLREDLIKKVDKVLVDAPCSGFGIIRKKPDIKWTKSLQDISKLAQIQKNILSAVSNYVKKGGILVYSTCTISKKENEEQLEQFLKNNQNFELLQQWQLFPHIDNCDGFFIGVLKCVR